MKILSREELVKLSTKRLLAYKNKLLQVPDASRCDCGSRGCDYLYNQYIENNVFFKGAALWQELYSTVKEILKGREHIPRKK